MGAETPLTFTLPSQCSYRRAESSGQGTLNFVAASYTREGLLDLRAGWKRDGKTVVFTNGCYDLLHPGHIRLLEAARSLGDVLILALNSDASVRRSKGPGRPVIPETARGALAAALEAVDAVVFFDEETPRELIAAVLARRPGQGRRLVPFHRRAGKRSKLRAAGS